MIEILMGHVLPVVLCILLLVLLVGLVYGVVLFVREELRNHRNKPPQPPSGTELLVSDLIEALKAADNWTANQGYFKHIPSGLELVYNENWAEHGPYVAIPTKVSFSWDQRKRLEMALKKMLGRKVHPRPDLLRGPSVSEERIQQFVNGSA